MPKRSLDWRLQAVESLHVILDRIGQDNVDAARGLLVEISKRLRLAQSFPSLYRASTRVDELREIVVTENYFVPYRVTPTSVEVVDVVHARRNWPNAPLPTF